MAWLTPAAQERRASGSQAGSSGGGSGTGGMDAEASGSQPRSSSSVPADTGARLRLMPRSLAPAVHLSYLHDGDQNGVCHFLGTNGGSQEWINPMLAGRLQARPPAACPGQGLCCLWHAGSL